MTRAVGARLAVTVTVALAVLAAAAAPAAAAEDTTIGQTPPALSWITLTDSRGIPLWNYELSLDRGGVLSPDKFFWASVTDTCWGIYRSWCALALWFLDWVLSFTWLQTIAAPLLSLGAAMEQIVGRLGLVATFLTLNALMAGLWMLRGRRSTAIWEIGIASVIAALAAGVFAHPVDLVAGPDGYITRASQLGQQLAAALSGGEATTSPDQLRHQQSGQLVDTFIRQPTQMINFGRVLDGGPCESAYTQVIAEGPYGTDSPIRDAVADCDNALGQVAANPSASMAIGSLVFMPAAFVILAMAAVLAGSVIAAALWAMFQSLKAVVTLVTGLLPGGGRGSLMLTIAETMVSLVVIVFASVFLAVFLQIVRAMFAATATGASVPQTFVIVDVLIVAGVVVYARQHRQIRATSHRLAQWLSHRPAGGATRLPDRALGAGMTPGTSGISRTVHSVAQTQALRAFAASRRVTPGPAAPPDTAAGGRAPHTAAPAAAASSTSSATPDPTSPASAAPSSSPSPSGGQAQRAGRVITGVLVRAGTHTALAAATGGSSTMVTAAARTARAAHSTTRMAVNARLAAAAITGPPDTPRSTHRPPTDPPSPSAAPATPAGTRTPDSAPPAPTPPAAAPPSQPGRPPTPAARRPSRPAIALPGRPPSTGGPTSEAAQTPATAPPRPAIALPGRTPSTTPTAGAPSGPVTAPPRALTAAHLAKPRPPATAAQDDEAASPGQRLHTRLAARQRRTPPSTGGQ